jgi:hypothetical protein
MAKFRSWPLTATEAGCVRKVDVKQIKAARELLGWSQDDLVKASGVSS